MSDRLDRFKAVLNSEHPEAVIAFVQHLSRLRSRYLIGRALAEQYPGEAEWQELLSSEGFLELVDEVVGFAVDVTSTVQLMGDLTDVERLQTSVQEEYPRALDAVADLAAALAVPGEDLLSVLLEA